MIDSSSSGLKVSDETLPAIARLLQARHLSTLSLHLTSFTLNYEPVLRAAIVDNVHALKLIVSTNGPYDHLAQAAAEVSERNKVSTEEKNINCRFIRSCILIASVQKYC